MSELPNRLSKGTHLPALWLNRLLDYLRSRDLRAGKGIRIDRTPSGTTISAIGSDETVERPMPFDTRMSPLGHLLCYVPNHNSGIVMLGDAAVRFIRPALVRNDWYDCGSFGVGNKLYLRVFLEEVADPSTARWALGRSPSEGTGESAVAPPVLIAEFVKPYGLLQRFHGPYLTSLGDPCVLDTDADPGNPPGESLNRFAADDGDEEHPDGQLQLRQFHDTTDTLSVEPVGSTGDGPTAANLDILMRNKGQGTAGSRPKLDYVQAADGPFFVKGATADQNYAASIKIGTPATGYVTISAIQ